MSNSQGKSVNIKKNKKVKHVEYGKYGYLFVAPFFIVYALFQLGPLCYTIWLSFMENYTIGFGDVIGPNFVGLANYKAFFKDNFMKTEVFKSLSNTIIMWVYNFVPQILLSLLFAKWFTDTRVKLKGQGAYKVLMFLPNIITAASISVLFYSLFSNSGPVTILLKDMHIIPKSYDFLVKASDSRILVAFIQFWMWYGNTMILLIAGMLGINPSLYEAAMVDGATSGQVFRSITVPLLKPIILFTLVTSAIGGLQMYDIPLLFNEGGPAFSTTTITMYIKTLTLASKDYGKASAASMVLFAVTLVISILFFIFLGDKDSGDKGEKVRTKKIKKVRKKDDCEKIETASEQETVNKQEIADEQETVNEQDTDAKSDN